MALLILPLLLAAPVLAGKRDEAKDETDHRSPKILLTASPAFGFAPLTVQLVATVSRIDTRDPNFCHAGITWVRVDPGGSPETGSKLTEDPECVHGDDRISVSTTYSKSFEISAPGSYLYRVFLDGKDGTQIRSNYVTVRVLRVS
jgi:hypothetical protein